MGLFDGNGRGPKGPLALHNLQKLDQAFDLMQQQPDLSFPQALQQVDADLSQVPQHLLQDAVRNQSADVQQKVADWATNAGDGYGRDNFASDASYRTDGNVPGRGLDAGPTTPGPAGSSNSGLPASNASTAATSFSNPTSSAPPIDPGVKILPATTTLAGNTVQALTRVPSELIQRLFNSESVPRTDTPQGTPGSEGRTTPGSAIAEARRTENVVALPRGDGNQSASVDRFTQQASQAPLQRGSDAVPLGGRVEGNQFAQAAQQPAQVRAEAPLQPAQARPDAQAAGHVGNAQASNAPAPAAQPQGSAQAGTNFAGQQATAQPQGAAQATANFAGQQAAAQPQGASQATTNFAQQQNAAQLAPQGTAAQQFANTPQPQGVPLAQGRPETLGGQQLPQQGMPNTQQNVPVAPQGGPQGTTAQLAPQAAGLAVVANPQSPAPSAKPQTDPNAVPPPPGAENAASKVRNSLLAPAGYTLAGFLRRNPRGQSQQQGRQPGKLAALMLTLAPLAKKHRDALASADAPTQAAFWLSTIAAYGALATAAVIMLADRGQLLDDKGVPTLGAYALVVGGLAAALSWWMGKQLAKSAET